MDESLSSIDVSTNRLSLVDSRRLLFEKIVADRTSNSILDDDDGVSDNSGHISQPSRVNEIKNYCDKLVSHNFSKFNIVNGTEDVDSETVPVGSIVNPISTPISVERATPVASSIAVDQDAFSYENEIATVSDSQECSLSNDISSSNGTQSSPYFSKRISYHHAVLNGAKLKLTKITRPLNHSGNLDSESPVHDCEFPNDNSCSTDEFETNNVFPESISPANEISTTAENDRLTLSSDNICEKIKDPITVKKNQPPFIDYPEELNPFGEDDDDDNNNNNECTVYNPFDTDTDTESDGACEQTTPSAVTNPFWCGSDEEDAEENMSSKSSIRTPVPLPRTVKKSVLTKSPLPSPRPRPRITTTCLSNETSLTPCDEISSNSGEISFHLSSRMVISTTSRKKKPAPLPPPLVTNVNNLEFENEDNRNSDVEQIQMTDSSDITFSDVSVLVTDSNINANKKIVSPWKNKKRPAPARPTPQRRPVKEMPLEDIKIELNDIEVRYQELERQIAHVEKMIRIKTKSESAESSVVEEMVVQLFELVNEKNELFRRRSELVNMRKMHSLEVEQADIEYQIRCLMLRPESNKTDTDKADEEALVKRLVQVVEKRNEIIDLMDQDRLRETVEDQSVTTQLGSKNNKREKKDFRSKEKKKINKREKNKEFDDEDKHSPSKLIKQKFMTLRHTAKKLHPKLPN